MHHHDSAYHMGTSDQISTDLDTNEIQALEVDITDSTESITPDECEGPNANEMVFSSLDTHFSFVVWLEQYIFHVFFPLTVPFAFYKFGLKHAQIQRYHYRDPVAYLFTYIPSMLMAYILYCLLAEPEILRVEMLMLPFGVVLMQRMMIAVKYASLSPDEYRAFMSVGGKGFFGQMSPADYAKTIRQNNLMQLNSGWIVIPDLLIRHELVVSSVVQGIDLSDLFFFVPVSDASSTREANPAKMHSDWMRLLKEPGSEFNLKRERSGAALDAKRARSSSSTSPAAPESQWCRTTDGQFLKVNCMDVCEYMFHVLNKRVGRVKTCSAVVSGLLSWAAAYNYWYWYSWVFKHSVTAKVFLLANMFLLVWFTPVLLMFCVTAVTDVYRRYEVGRMLRELITVSDVRMVDTSNYDRFQTSKRRKESVKAYTCAAEQKIAFQSFSSTALPRIDMSMPANYVSWCMCRQVLARFGHRFVFRTNLYLGILALLVLIQVVNTLVNIFLSSMAPEDVCHTFNFVATILSVILITVLLCVLMTGIIMTNRRMQKHRIQISTHLLHASKALHELMFRDSMRDDRDESNSFKCPLRVQKTHKYRTISSRYAAGNDLLSVTKEEVVRDTAQLKECIEAANSVVQAVSEFDGVQPMKFLDLHVEVEHIISVASSMLVYGLVLYNFCAEGRLVS